MAYYFFEPQKFPKCKIEIKHKSEIYDFDFFPSHFLFLQYMLVL
jgi:hypothetical protein